MSAKILTDDEKSSLDLLKEDMRYLLARDEILQNEAEDVLEMLKSEEVRSYVRNLRYGSKPETALRESFVAGKSILLKYVFGEAAPEVRSNGFIDYLIKDELGRGIALELKPLFEAEVQLDKAGKPILKRLKQKKIRPEDHKDQILKYVREGEAQYVILTNLKEWFFYNSEVVPKKVQHFYATDFFNFINEYAVVEDLWDYLERREKEHVSLELDKKFFMSLKTWVEKLSATIFTVDSRKKLELIIKLINKFIFVKTLDDYGVIEFSWIRKRWNHHEQMWQRKGKSIVLEKFLEELDQWFYLYYDTELFRERVIEYIKKDDENIDRFYHNLKLVLGITYAETPSGALNGIIQFNFRYIDEDILGRAYETFLAEVRKEEGVYYTPKYVTRYIAENTVGRVFGSLLARIEKDLTEGDFEEAKNLVESFVSTRVLDPACGSGSFLIKAIGIIFNKYGELKRAIAEAESNYTKKNSKYLGSLVPPAEVSSQLELISKMKRLCGPSNDRELISRILLRHIHGNDLDARALEVAKVSMWLEAIKLSPKEFRYDRLPTTTNHILPNLEMNLCNGDSIFGLPQELSIKYLSQKYSGELIELSELRQKYLNNPEEPRFVEEIESRKRRIRENLDREFSAYLTTEKIQITDQTKPLHWVLEFWYVFFDENANALHEEEAGFGIVIGNPPYVDYRSVKPLSLHKFFKVAYESANVSEKYNVYVLFIEKGLKLLHKGGQFGYINPLQWMSSLMASELRRLILDKYDLHEIDDLSSIGVFEEPTLTNLGLFFIRNEEATDLIRVGYRITKKQMIESNIPFTTCRKSETLIGDERTIMLNPNVDVNRLAKKIEHNTKLLEISRLEWGTSQSGYGKKKISSEAHKKLDADKRQQYEPLVQTGDIHRHIILWKGEYIDKSIYSDKKKEQFGRPKIIFSRRAPTVECVYDTNGFYLGKVAFTSETGRSFDFSFMLGILNSSLIDFYFRTVYETLQPGGNLRFDIPYLHKLPVVLPEEENSAHFVQQIKEATERVLKLKGLRYELIEVWRNWSMKLKTHEISLDQLLSEETKLMREGELTKIWTTKSTFYSATDKAAITKEFRYFRIEGDNRKAILAIWGFDKNGVNETVYEAEFKNRDLMSHVYLSLLSILESRLDISTVVQLFTKTRIPIIKEVNKWSSEMTPNILSKTREEVAEWLRDKKMEGVDIDIAKIDKEVEDLEARIDALAFKSYGITEDEVRVVFDTLHASNVHKENVIEFFRKLY